MPYKNPKDPAVKKKKAEQRKGIVMSEEHEQEHTPSEKAHFQRSMSHLHQGALHRHLGIAEGQPIPLEKKEEAAHSDNKHVAAMGRMALAMHGWSKHHGKEKK